MFRFRNGLTREFWAVVGLMNERLGGVLVVLTGDDLNSVLCGREERMGSSLSIWLCSSQFCSE